MTAFNIDAATRIARVTTRQIRYWDQTGLVRPSVAAARGRGSRRLYSFEDLLELRVVRQLLDAGLSLQRVRKVARALRSQQAELRRPLTKARLIVDGSRVLIWRDLGRVEDLLAKGQGVFIFSLAKLWRELQAGVTRLSELRAALVSVGGQRYAVTFEPDLEDGGWVAECPSLPGCVSQGETLTETRRMIREAITAWLADREATTGVDDGHAQRARR